MSNRSLIVIGAGPKGLAIAAKNKVLKKLGLDAPKVIIIEKSEVAAHWTGKRGYTNGNMTLGTGPEKDIGYPYDTSEYDVGTNNKINKEMMKFSWMSYLISTGEYSDYIDKGRPFPKHREYAEYLRWVFSEILDSVELIIGSVVSLDTNSEENILVTYKTKKDIRTIEGDGLMMTGPGMSNTALDRVQDPRVLDIERFWINYRNIDFNSSGKIAIVGAGENSASIALALGEIRKDLQIDIITPSGFIFTRGESYFENRVYSNPKSGQWNSLTDEDKKNFIKRTDLGVFGQYAQAQLNERNDINIIPGRVLNLKVSDNKVRAGISYGSKEQSGFYDYVIIATGFDQLKLFRDLSTKKLLSKVREDLTINELNQESLESLIDTDMSIEGLFPKIHLPMISRMKQGPGFANLSSLGRLSDQVLFSYLKENKKNNEKEKSKFMPKEATC